MCRKYCIQRLSIMQYKKCMHLINMPTYLGMFLKCHIKRYFHSNYLWCGNSIAWGWYQLRWYPVRLGGSIMCRGNFIRKSFMFTNINLGPSWRMFYSKFQNISSMFHSFVNPCRKKMKSWNTLDVKPHSQIPPKL
jgi:hypothetical protein